MTVKYPVLTSPALSPDIAKSQWDLQVIILSSLDKERNIRQHFWAYKQKWVVNCHGAIQAGFFCIHVLFCEHITICKSSNIAFENLTHFSDKYNLRWYSYLSKGNIHNNPQCEILCCILTINIGNRCNNPDLTVVLAFRAEISKLKTIQIERISALWYLQMVSDVHNSSLLTL